MKAYLIGVLKTDRYPPVLTSIGVYSEDARSLTNVVKGEILVDLFIEADERDFVTARLDVLTIAHRAPWLRWIEPLLSGEDCRIYQAIGN